MPREELAREARKCRRLAAQFAGKRELPILLKLADAFEELAGANGDRRTPDQ